MATVIDYLQNALRGRTPPPGQFVRLRDVVTDVAYVSTSAAASDGKFSIPNVPAGRYNVDLGKAASGPWLDYGEHNYCVTIGALADNFLWMPPNAGDAWTAALSGASTKHASSGIFGASVAQGGSALPDVMTQSYFEVDRDVKIAKYGLYGDAWPIAYYNANFSFGSLAASGWPCTFDVNPTSMQVRGPLLGPSHAGLSGSPLWHMDTPYSRTRDAVGRPIFAAIADLILFDCTGMNGWTITLNVDGQTPVMKLDGVDQPGGVVTLGGTNTLRRLRIVGRTGQNPLDPTVKHTINITAQSNAGASSTIILLCTYPTNVGGAPVDAGVGFARFCSGSWTLHEVARTDAGTPFPTDKLVLHQGGALPSTQFGFPFDLSRAILDVYDDPIAHLSNTPVTGGQNPSYPLYGLSPSGYRAATRRLCNALRAGRLNATNGAYGCSFDFVFPSVPDRADSDVGNGGIPVGWRAWLTAMKQVRDEVNGRSYDALTDFAEYGVHYGWQGATNVHPLPPGAARMAAQVGILG